MKPNNFSAVVQCEDDKENWTVLFDNEDSFFLFVDAATHMPGLRWLAYDTSEFGGFTPLDYHREGNRTYFTDPFDRIVFEGNALEKGA